VALRKDTSDGPVGAVVLDHAERKVGTLKGILQLARVDYDAFGERI
jgi:hypothetical protein